MTLPGETILTGAPEVCPDCKISVIWGVYKSAAGWYVGTYCNCGPYSRESGYFASYDDAKTAMDEMEWIPRDTNFNG